MALLSVNYCPEGSTVSDCPASINSALGRQNMTLRNEKDSWSSHIYTLNVASTKMFYWLIESKGNEQT